MKPTILFAVLMLGAGAALAQEPAAADALPAPKLVCDEPTYRFGDMDSSRDVEHSFILRNEGNATLEIQRARPSCGCTVASISRNSVPPGEQAEIKTRLSLRNRQGPQHKIITVESNDPQTPQLVLALEGNAVTEMVVRPTQLFFGRINADAIVTGVVEIAVNSSNAVAITKTGATPQLDVRVETNAPGRSYRVLAVTRPPLPQGTLRANVHIETDSPRFAAMDIGVSAFVVGTLTVAPEAIDLPPETSEPVTRYVILRGETGRGFRILAAETPDPAVVVGVQETAPFTYRIEIRNIADPRKLEGKGLLIRTDLPDRPEIIVPFQLKPPPA